MTALHPTAAALEPGATAVAAPTEERRGVAILGSTASIGTTALRVLARQSGR